MIAVSVSDADPRVRNPESQPTPNCPHDRQTVPRADGLRYTAPSGKRLGSSPGRRRRRMSPPRSNLCPGPYGFVRARNTQVMRVHCNPATVGCADAVMRLDFNPNRQGVRITDSLAIRNVDQPRLRRILRGHLGLRSPCKNAKPRSTAITTRPTAFSPKIPARKFRTHKWAR
jgi:hypothetical protein